MLNDNAAQVVCCGLQTQSYTVTETPRAFTEKTPGDKSLNTASWKAQSWENTVNIYGCDLGLNINYTICHLKNPH